MLSNIRVVVLNNTHITLPFEQNISIYSYIPEISIKNCP